MGGFGRRAGIGGVGHHDAAAVPVRVDHQFRGEAALVAVMRNVLIQHRVRSDRLQTALESLSPMAILERGYALVFDSQGRLLKDMRSLKLGDEISARLAHGEFHAAVTKKQE